MAVKLSSALSQLLGKLGLAPGAAKGQHSEGLEKGHAKHPEKGDVLGEHGELLVGLGFNPEDRARAKKNAKEEANVHEFVQARGQSKSGDKADKADKTRTSEENKPEESASKPSTGQEERTLRDEGRARTARDDRAEEARAKELQEQPKDEAGRREREGKDPLIERVKDRDEDAHGHAWVQEALEEEEEEGSGYRNQEVLSDQLRCHGTQDDGTRCLHRAIDGQPFCRAHLAHGHHTP